jgi:hypothetical protein
MSPPIQGRSISRSIASPRSNITALAGTRRDAGVSVAEVNLKLIWDVVSQIKVGERGQAYVGDMTRLAQVAAAPVPVDRSRWPASETHHKTGLPLRPSYVSFRRERT